MRARGASLKNSNPTGPPSLTFERNSFYDNLAGEQGIDPARFALKYSPATLAAYL